MTIQRRTFLQGLALGAGACMLEPFVRRLEAFAAGEPAPIRLVLLVEGDHLSPSRVMPSETLAALAAARGGSADPHWKSYTVDTPLVTEGLTLPRALEPLTPHIDDLSMVFGLSNRIAGGGHSGEYGALSCTPSTRRVPGGQTLDNFLGERVGADSVFERLALGVIEFGENADGTVAARDLDYHGSAGGPGRPLPVYVNPVAAHELLFGSVGAADAAANFERKTTLLDSVADDVRRLTSQIPGSDRYFLDEFLAGIERLSLRQSRIVSMEDALAAGRPELADTYYSPHPLVRLEAQCDLAAAALATGQTNVALIAAGCSHLRFSMRYTSLDPGIIAKHGLGHGNSYGGQPPTYWLSEIHHRHAVGAARLIEHLKAVPEGDGFMWDNTLLVYLADGGNSHHSTFSDWPAVLVAGKNVPIRRTAGGRSVIYPRLGSDGHRQLSNLYNTLCHAVGAPEDEFGGEGATRVAPGPLEEVLMT